MNPPPRLSQSDALMPPRTPSSCWNWSWYCLGSVIPSVTGSRAPLNSPEAIGFGDLFHLEPTVIVDWSSSGWTKMINHVTVACFYRTVSRNPLLSTVFPINSTPAGRRPCNNTGWRGINLPWGGLQHWSPLNCSQMGVFFGTSRWVGIRCFVFPISSAWKGAGTRDRPCTRL